METGDCSSVTWSDDDDDDDDEKAEQETKKGSGRGAFENWVEMKRPRTRRLRKAVPVLGLRFEVLQITQ